MYLNQVYARGYHDRPTDSLSDWRSPYSEPKREPCTHIQLSFSFPHQGVQFGNQEFSWKKLQSSLEKS